MVSRATKDFLNAFQPRKPDTTTFIVVFYMGGAATGSWHKGAPEWRLDAARVIAEEIEKGGRAAIIRTSAELEVIGMPEGAPPDWDFGRLCWRTPLARRRAYRLP